MSGHDTIPFVCDSSARSDAAYAQAADTSWASGGGEPSRERRSYAPGELVSLWDMLRFHAHDFVLLMNTLSTVERLIKDLATGDHFRTKAVDDHLKSVNIDVSQLPEGELLELQKQALPVVCKQFWESIAPLIDMTETNCRQLSLLFALPQIERMRERFGKEEFDVHDFRAAFNDLTQRIKDELRNQTFMLVSTERAKYLSESPLFGDKVAARLPKQAEDIAEAGKCIAFGRYTASVFHLMRVMEVGVRRLAKALGIVVNLDQAWGVILQPIDAGIAALPGGVGAAAKEKARKAKLSEAAVFLRHVKDAWRNDTMHPKRTYTEEEAVRVFECVKTFIQQLVKLR